MELSRSPSQKAKAVGLQSLTQVSEITGMGRNTLTNWSRDKPDLFQVVLYGCLYSIHRLDKGE